MFVCVAYESMASVCVRIIYRTLLVFDVVVKRSCQPLKKTLLKYLHWFVQSKPFHLYVYVSLLFTFRIASYFFELKRNKNHERYWRISLFL